MQKHKKKGGSVQDLLGIKTFTRYGLATKNGELVFFLVSPTNISVLSHASIEAKIHHLMMVLCTHPDIEIVCTDSQVKKYNSRSRKGSSGSKTSPRRSGSNQLLYAYHS